MSFCKWCANALSLRTCKDIVAVFMATGAKESNESNETEDGNVDDSHAQQNPHCTGVYIFSAGVFSGRRCIVYTCSGM